MFDPAPPPSPTALPDPALAIAERQLAMLGELAEMGLVVSRCYAHAAVAASAAVETILADEHWQPETGRARALAGARDAADAFQKVARSLRLTLRLELETAEALRDPRAGIVAADGKNAETSPKPPVSARISRLADIDTEGAFASEERKGDERPGGERERAEFDRPDRIYPRGFITTVNGRRGEAGFAGDWSTAAPDRAKPRHQPFEPKPVGWECRPPAAAARDGPRPSLDAGGSGARRPPGDP